MNMKRVICIYPQDKSTDFLLPVYEQLEQMPNFVGFRFNTMTSPQTKELYTSTNFDKESLLVFLGHGASNRLYGSVDEKGTKQELFNKDNTDHIRNLDFFCIACRSNEFAHNHFQNYIGFGDITSDFSEIEAERNLGDSHYMNWATEEDLSVFQQEFTGAIVDAIRLTNCKSLSSIYKMLKLCFNKRIATLLVNKNISNYRHIADMLFDVTNDIECNHIHNTRINE